MTHLICICDLFHHPLALLGIWLVGGILSFPRMVASFYSIEETFTVLRPRNCAGELFASIFFGWITVLVGILIYFKDEEKYFWKWSKKDIRKKFDDRWQKTFI